MLIVAVFVWIMAALAATQLSANVRHWPLKSATRLALGFTLVMLALYIGEPRFGFFLWHQVVQTAINTLLFIVGATLMLASVGEATAGLWRRLRKAPVGRPSAQDAGRVRPSSAKAARYTEAMLRRRLWY